MIRHYSVDKSLCERYAYIHMTFIDDPLKNRIAIHRTGKTRQDMVHWPFPGREPLVVVSTVALLVASVGEAVTVASEVASALVNLHRSLASSWLSLVYVVSRDFDRADGLSLTLRNTKFSCPSMSAGKT